MKGESGYIAFINDYKNSSGGESVTFQARTLVDTQKNKLSLVKSDGPCFNVVGNLKEDNKDKF